MPLDLGGLACGNDPFPGFESGLDSDGGEVDRSPSHLQNSRCQPGQMMLFVGVKVVETLRRPGGNLFGLSGQGAIEESLLLLGAAEELQALEERIVAEVWYHE